MARLQHITALLQTLADDLSNFNRQFRIEHGVTPSEYHNRAGRYPTRGDLSGR